MTSLALSLDFLTPRCEPWMVHSSDQFLVFAQMAWRPLSLNQIPSQTLDSAALALTVASQVSPNNCSVWSEVRNSITPASSLTKDADTQSQRSCGLGKSSGVEWSRSCKPWHMTCHPPPGENFLSSYLRKGSRHCKKFLQNLPFSTSKTFFLIYDIFWGKVCMKYNIIIMNPIVHRGWGPWNHKRVKHSFLQQIFEPI